MHARSPGHGHCPPKPNRKANNSYAITMESAPMEHLRVVTNAGICSNADPESSDAAAPTGGYRVMPSDTDTSAFDSDAIGLAGSGENYEGGGGALSVAGGGGGGGGGGGHPSDSGTDRPLLHASQRAKTKSERLAAR